MRDAVRRLYLYTGVLLLIAILSSRANCANIAKFLERDPLLTVTRRLNFDKPYKRTIEQPNQLTDKQVNTVEPIPLTPETFVDTPDTPETPDNKDRIPKSFGKDVENHFAVTSGDGSATDTNSQLLETEGVPISLSSLKNATIQTKKATIQTKKDTLDNTDSAPQTAKKTSISPLNDKLNENSGAINQINLNHAMLDNFLTLFRRSTILKNGHSHKNSTSKFSKSKTGTKTLKGSLNKSITVHKKNTALGKKLATKSNDPSGVGEKATKKQILDTPQREELGGDSLGEAEQEGGLTGLGSDVDGVPTGMGAGAEPLGAYENQRGPDNMDVRQQELMEDQEGFSNAPLSIPNHKGEIQDASMGDQSQVEIDPNAMKMDSYGNQRNEYKLGLDPNQLNESPSDLTQSINIAGVDKNINIQGDQEVGEIVQQHRQKQLVSPFENQVIVKNYHQNLHHSSRDGLKTKGPISYGADNQAENNGKLPSTNSDSENTQISSEDSFWDKNGNIEFEGIQGEAEKDVPEKVKYILQLLDKEAQSYEMANKGFYRPALFKNQEMRFLANIYDPKTVGTGLNSDVIQEFHRKNSQPSHFFEGPSIENRNFLEVQHQTQRQAHRENYLRRQWQRQREYERKSALKREKEQLIEQQQKEHASLLAYKLALQEQKNFLRPDESKSIEPEMSFMSDRGARQSAETIDNSNSKQMPLKSSGRLNNTPDDLDLTPISSDVLNMEQVAMKKKKKKKRTNVIKLTGSRLKKKASVKRDLK